MTLYSGTCEGGPLHGQRLHHGTRQYPVAMWVKTGKTVTWFGPATSEIEVSCYEFEKGKWMWRP